MKLKVIALGSTPSERKIFRWGLSFLLGEDLLFDTFGREDVFEENIKSFGIDPMKIKHVVISHSHWDHTKGLFWLLENYKDKNFKIYICPDFAQGFKMKLRKYNVQIIEAKGRFRIKRNIYTTGQINKSSIPEQALIIEREKGLILIAGCAHPGIVKMIDKAERGFSKQVVYILGGFHLKDKTKDQIEKVVSEIKKRGVKRVSPTHCTGKVAEEYFRKSWKRNFTELKEGDVIEI